MQNITPKEVALLRAIATSQYQDGTGEDVINHDIWLDYVVDSRSRGGVLSSLIKKGLVSVTIIPLAQSDNRQNGISDSTVCLTEAGYRATL